jgi:glycosyltransferase involved in cell wall biosynthesis
MEVSNQALVSCICVTHHNTALLTRAIRCYQQQSYGRKELIVACSPENVAAIRLVESLQDPAVRIFVFPTGIALALGEKRNMAIAFSQGFYICVWDDDDWYGAHRLQVQIGALSGVPFKSCALAQVILYDSQTASAYLSATRLAWEQTLLCEKRVFESDELKYASLDRAEDSPLLFNLKKRNLLLTIGHPQVYVYVYHGNNTSHRTQWEVNLLPWAKKWPASQALVVQDILNEKLVYADASKHLLSFVT